MTDAFAQAGLLDGAGAWRLMRARYEPDLLGRDDFDTEDDYENWLADQAEDLEVDIAPQVIAPHLTTETQPLSINWNSAEQVWDPRHKCWISNTDANRQHIGGDNLMFRWAQDIPARERVR